MAAMNRSMSTPLPASAARAAGSATIARPATAASTAERSRPASASGAATIMMESSCPVRPAIRCASGSGATT